MKSVPSLKDRLNRLDEFWGDVISWISVEALSDGVIKELLKFLPEIVSDPATTTVRIIVNEKEFKPKKFKKGASSYCSSIMSNHHEIGKLELHYLSEKPESGQDDGWEADHLLLKSLGEKLSYAIEIHEKTYEIERLKEEALTAYDRTIEAWAAEFETQQIGRAHV